MRKRGAGGSVPGPRPHLVVRAVGVDLKPQHAAVEVERALQVGAEQRHVVHAMEQHAACGRCWATCRAAEEERLLPAPGGGGAADRSAAPRGAPGGGGVAWARQRERHGGGGEGAGPSLLERALRRRPGAL